METLRVGLVTDIHAGNQRSNIKSGEAIALLDNVVRQANDRALDLFVTLGDNVNATDPEHDRHWLGEVGTSLSRLDAPAVPLFGNNELKFLDADEVAAALGCSAQSEVRRVKGWTLIFWRPGCTLSLQEGLRLSAPDLAWLRAALEAASYPAVLFLHVPIDEHSMVGNYYFQNCPELASYANAAEARREIERSGKVVLVLTGHVHWNAGSTIDGVHYRTLAALTDTFLSTAAQPSETWAALELAGDGQLSLDVFGRETARWSAPIKPESARWREPLSRADFDARMQALWEQGHA
ncbi:MAG: metallophosphoesterase [Hyphomicrobiales bacterium]|nr:metallophosphoesterase [Hyphomicrobiales bacterium]